jgi:hypothetical protein
MRSPCRDCMDRTKDAALCRKGCKRLEAFQRYLSGAFFVWTAVDPAGVDYSFVR